MQYVNIQKVEDTSIVILTISREKALNALNNDVLVELDEALDTLKAEKPECVILTGAGQKSFVAGADIDYMSRMNKAEAEEFSAYGSAVFRKIETFPAPVIGAVNGYALGGGLELAMACDFRIASDNAIFGLPELSLGIIPGFGGTQRLMRIVGMGKAKQMLFTSERIGADKALDIGLVNEVVTIEELPGRALEIANKIVRNAPEAVEMAKKSMNTGIDEKMDAAIGVETSLFPYTFETSAQIDRMKKFLDKSRK